MSTPVYPYLGWKQQCTNVPIVFPAQHQNRRPGYEYLMNPRPISDNPSYVGSGRLKDKVAIITGGDSGIGRAVAIAFAKQGADLVIPYLDEHKDAEETKQMIQKLGRRCHIMAIDLRAEGACAQVVQTTLRHYGKLNILVNNHGVQYHQNSILDISREQLLDTFHTNIISFFEMIKAALPHLPPGSSIINTTSDTAFSGMANMIDYTATKGAIVSMTRSLSLSIAKSGIRVNAVAPGPTWTPLIPTAFTAEETTTFGTDVPLGRPGQPFELAPAYVMLASDDGSYISGQTVFVNGGTIVT
ncbi:NAD(P)-dependent dehydrogenase (short-subunit alcohol dehydrogenase family) [Paenibacillus cellulosilyticus]|uniref:NAD(P)-dependent dehydrogenase (Short-subunit alcohol dehydrogenase family) n=1 Tax=Paenibacillus cellulosilyticus TaxID=375489 RepID=A0A2V2YX10_9BACL|nr:SDR family oxidoreductase [Paenibacillus cellulosilyticus]PWW04728.1 NAD(P)-dependent dehydrogenase (short-subunit alcohol dehydrogenase family) [Paenibacillus cellulosilyticus]QKS45854.1 SDR family oxidoreductase [Paenibacillus cellulosilyticus]